MSDPNKRMEQRDLERRRIQELKDLETERDTSPRPLEGLTGGSAGTTWTEDQDESVALEVHGDDEARSRLESEREVPSAQPCTREE